MTTMQQDPATRRELADAMMRLCAVDAVRREEDALGEWYSALGDDVRAAAHLQCAAHLRAVIPQLLRCPQTGTGAEGGHCAA